MRPYAPICSTHGDTCYVQKGYASHSIDGRDLALSVEATGIMGGQQPLRVAHICEEFVHGGIEYLILDLCRALERRGVSNSINFFYGDDLLSGLNDCMPAQVIPLRMNRHSRIGAVGLFRLRRALLKFQPDLLHCHSYYAVCAALVLRGLGLPLPVVFTVHGDVYPWMQRSNFVIRLAANRSDRVVAVSTHTAKTVENFTGGKVHPVVIYNGIELTRVVSTNGFRREASRRELGLDKDVLALLMIARLTTQKDHPTLFNAFRQALPRLGNARLLIVGEGTERARLEQLIRELRMEKEITIYGSVPDINPYLSAADVFVLSTRNEGFGICVIEACCAGLPVVATGLGPLLDLCNSGLDLVLAKPNDVESLREALVFVAEPHVRQALSQQRVRVTQLFSMDRTAAEYLTVYHGLVHGRVEVRACCASTPSHS